jgi:predicted amidohydrolase YtcJ
MKQLILAGAVTAALLIPRPARAQNAADVVLTGGAVYTMDARRSWAQAVAIRGGRIVYVGSDAGARPWVGAATRVVPLGGRMVLPGFQDAHVHPVSGGIELGQCDLNNLSTREAIVEKVRACAGTQAGRPWVVGGGWALPAFPGGAPTRELLDSLVPDRPAYLSAADGHSAWVNSEALRRAGITAATPDPAGGRIERDATGEPTGTLRESANDLVARLLPAITAAERLAGLQRALALFAGFGITAVQEANASRAALEAYREAERGGTLTLRVAVALSTDAERGPEQVAGLVKLRDEFTSARVRPTAAKIFADGVIEARTAAMLDPYLDRPGQRGEPNLPPDRLNAIVARLVENGFAVHIHAIGDGAVRFGLDALEAAGARAGAEGRHQLAHIEVIDRKDVPRFRTLGVIANFQPLWAQADTYITDLTVPALGPERTRRLYPIADVAAAGGLIAFGSDWSVSSPNPLEGIQVAITRQAPREPRTPPLLPEQAVDLPTALAAYTIGAAQANGLAQDTGSLEAGKAADLIVLSPNLFTLPPDQIASARVLLTLVEGRPVFRSPELEW